MAASAFKSKTKRECVLASNEGRSARPTLDMALLRKEVHIRSSSLTDFPQTKYVSNSTESKVIDIGRLLRRQLSENDVGKGRNADTFENMSETTASPRVSSHDCPAFVKRLEESNLGSAKHGENPECQVEEKIIRPVHAQNKRTWARSFSGKLNASDSYNTIRTEVWQAVFDLMGDEEQSPGTSWALKCLTCGARNDYQTAIQGEIVKAVTIICKDYRAKLQESEKEIHNLQAQLALEEERSEQNAKIIRDLFSRSIPRQKESSDKEQFLAERMPHEYDNWYRENCILLSPRNFDEVNSLMERSFSQSLIEEPTKGSTLGIADSVQYANSTMDEEMACHAGGNSKDLDCLEFSRRVTVSDNWLDNKDGLVLPWLDCDQTDIWNTHALTTKIVKHKDAPVKPQKNQAAHNGTGLDKLFERKSASSRLGIKIYHKPFDTNYWKERSSSYIDVDELLSERIHFRRRIESSELVLCMGTLQLL